MGPHPPSSKMCLELRRDGLLRVRGRPGPGTSVPLSHVAQPYSWWQLPSHPAALEILPVWYLGFVSPWHYQLTLQLCPWRVRGFVLVGEDRRRGRGGGWTLSIGTFLSTGERKGVKVQMGGLRIWFAQGYTNKQNWDLYVSLATPFCLQFLK